MSFYRMLVFLFVIHCTACLAKVAEIHSMQELENYLKPNSLIVFDIDNTLMEPVQELGSDQWFRYQYDCHCKKGIHKEEALHNAVAEWTAVQHATKVKAVEPEIPEIVSRLQKNKYTVIGLTTRSFDMGKLTRRQLKSINIDLLVTSPTKEDIFFINECPNLFHDGILFTANTHKGEALRKLLNALNYKPSSIIFINDKYSHIQPVEEYCKKDNVPFMGLRYGYLDSKVKAFDARIANIQFENFCHILSNEEAQSLN